MDIIRALYNKWCQIPDLIRFFFIGGINFLIGYAIFVIALLLLGEQHHQLAVVIQWVVSSVPSYFNQKFFVFCTKGNYWKEYIKCFSTWVISYFLNVIILEILVRIHFLNVFYDQIISLFLVSLVTYVMFKFFAFKKK